MSYLSNALVRMSEQRGLIQADLARQTGLSRAHISRVCGGEATDLADHHFAAMLKVFAADTRAQAELIAARCLDARAGVATSPGAALVEITIKEHAPAAKAGSPTEFPHVELSHETERAFSWLRSQCPVNHELEKHMVAYARLLGMP